MKGIATGRIALTLVGPLSIRMPVAEYTRENQWQNFPVMPVGVDDAGSPMLTGYLPATTLRGVLRRGIVVPLMEAAAAQGNPYPLGRAYAELIGQDTASEKQPDEIDLLEIQRLRDESAVVDLFGSGLGVKSRLMVSHLVPEHPTLPIPFTAVRKDLGDSEGVLEAMSDDDRDAYLLRERTNSKRAQALSLVAGLERRKRKGEAVSVELAAAQELLARHETDMGDMKNSSRSLFSHFALPTGLTLTGRLVIRDPKDRDFQMLEIALDSLSRFPVLGAQSARGCGEVEGVVRFDEKVIAFGGYQPARVTKIEGVGE